MEYFIQGWALSITFPIVAGLVLIVKGAFRSSLDIAE